MSTDENTKPDVSEGVTSPHRGGSTPDTMVITTVATTVKNEGTRADVVTFPSLDQVREYIRASKAENTLRGYESDWRDFCGWCEGRGLCRLPAPPETVAAYIAE